MTQEQQARLDHLRQIAAQLTDLEAVVIPLRMTRMGLTRGLLSAGMSEWHLADVLGITHAEVRRWAWREVA